MFLQRWYQKEREREKGISEKSPRKKKLTEPCKRNRAVDTTFFVVFCECMDEYGPRSASLIRHPASTSSSSQQQQQQQASSSSPSSSTTRKPETIMKNLVGLSVASPAKLYDAEGEFGIFFVFPDLSLRSEGRFRLAFSLFNIGKQV